MPFGGDKKTFSSFRSNVQNAFKLEYGEVETESIFGKKIATVLYVLKEGEPSRFLSDYSRMASSFLQKDPQAKLVRCVIRIPGIHDYLPPPSYEDIEKAKTATSLESLKNTIIYQHPIAVASTADLPIPEVGQIIWVSVTQTGANILYVYDNYIGRTSQLLVGPNLSPDMLLAALSASGQSTLTLGTLGSIIPIAIDKHAHMIMLRGEISAGGRITNEPPAPGVRKWRTRAEYSDYAVYRKEVGRWHFGIDISVDEQGGDPWFSPVAGVIVRANESPTYRPFVICMKANDGYYHLFAHLSVKLEHRNVGDTVSQGDLIGYTTPKHEIEANSKKLGKPPFIPHVHYEILHPSSGGYADKENRLHHYMDPMVFLTQGRYQNDKAKRNFSFPVYYNI